MSRRSCFAWMGVRWPFVCSHRDENSVSSVVQSRTLCSHSPQFLRVAEITLFQVRNPHDYLGDFQAELPLYERAGALVDFLLSYTEAEGTSNSGGLTWSRVEDLAVTMYEYGIVEEEDVLLAQVGFVGC